MPVQSKQSRQENGSWTPEEVERRRIKKLARAEQKLNPELKYTQARRLVLEREAAEKENAR